MELEEGRGFVQIEGSHGSLVNRIVLVLDTLRWRRGDHCDARRHVGSAENQVPDRRSFSLTVASREWVLTQRGLDGRSVGRPLPSAPALPVGRIHGPWRRGSQCR